METTGHCSRLEVTPAEAADIMAFMKLPFGAISLFVVIVTVAVAISILFPGFPKKPQSTDEDFFAGILTLVVFMKVAFISVVGSALGALFARAGLRRHERPALVWFGLALNAVVVLLALLLWFRSVGV